jgi:hypothetical protein
MVPRVGNISITTSQDFTVFDTARPYFWVPSLCRVTMGVCAVAGTRET